MALAIALRNPLTKLGLRARVAVLFAVLGLVVSACLALGAVHFSDSYVHRLMDEMLRVEGEYLSERYAEDGRRPHPRSKHFYAFVSGAEARDAPPAEWLALEPGVYEMQDPSGAERHVAVYTIADRKLYVVLDIGLESVRERRLARDLIALVLFGTALSAWLGWFWAGRAIEPVRRLAQQVDVLEPSRHAVARLAPDFAADEVGALASAFDRHQEKLYEYVRRERTFTADASHELRTPLAVIRGAIEVMRDNGDCDAATTARLMRMQRGADELRDLLDALLVLARSDEREANLANTPDLGALVVSLLGERADALREKHLLVEHDCTQPVAVAAPQRVLYVVIGNLLRAVTEFADGGLLQIQLTSATLSIAHECASSGDSGIRKRRTLDVREHALGLGMIRRVCERWGWILEESLVPNDGRRFVLRFG